MNAALAFLIALLVICAIVGVVAAVLDRRRGGRIERDLRRQAQQRNDPDS